MSCAQINKNKKKSLVENKEKYKYPNIKWIFD